MDEKKKMFILLGIVGIIILFIAIGSVIEDNKSKSYLKEFYSDLNGNENSLIMIGRDNCSWCQLFKPTLDYMSDKYDFDFTYVNTNELTNSAFNKMLKSINVSSDEFGTPFTVVTKNGKVVDSLNGYTDEIDLLEFLKKYGFVDSDAKLALNYVDYSGYKKILKSDKASILVVGQTTCSYCIKSKPILNEIVDSNNITINYINVNKLSEEESEKFKNSLDYLRDEQWGTPLTLIIKDGKVIDSANGLLDKDGYVELFKKNGIIK